jgi:phosphomethylpyrimidine synthase
MNQLESALSGIATPEMEQVAQAEGVAPGQVREGVANGTIVILHNRNRHNTAPTGIGKGLRTKVSASIGLYGDDCSIEGEVAKIKAAISAGTDAIMDLSVSGDIDAMLQKTLTTARTPVGTLPIYQALAQAAQKKGSSAGMEVEDLFGAIERQAAAGVDFLALHCGTTMAVVQRAKQDGRLDPLVSFGGSHLIGWMVANQRENPLYEQYDRVLEIAHEYDLTLSLADGMRPGCLTDSLDSAQVQEMTVFGELVRRARKAGVQIMIKGPGHVPLQQIKTTVVLQKSLCKGAPYFVFGPLVTDIAVGYDQINAAIGGAISAWAGAEFLCYVTAAEHVGIPTCEQVRNGVIAARIAAHAGDLAREAPSAMQWDLQLSRARKDMDWTRQFELAIDPQEAARMKEARSGSSTTGCAMCGKYCAAEIMSQYLNTNKHTC